MMSVVYNINGNVNNCFSHRSVVSWVGLTFFIMLNQLSPSDTHSGRMLFFFMSSFNRSIHLSLGLPLGQDPSIRVFRTTLQCCHRFSAAHDRTMTVSIIVTKRLLHKVIKSGATGIPDKVFTDYQLRVSGLNALCSSCFEEVYSRHIRSVHSAVNA